ncbi:sulfatase-like hydrolase/transferase [Pasteurella multocida]
MTRPNIIFYFTDQQRWDTVGAYGQPLDITPTLDKLAEDGVVFEEAYSSQPVCGPCRSIFQTGLYPTETGCFRNNIALPEGVKTIADYFNEKK